MSIVDAFINLRKPSVWLINPREHEIERLINKFPSVIISRNDGLYIDYWFFKDESIKDKFEHLGIAEDLINGERNHKKLGELLGYPPKAIENFLKSDYDYKLQRTKIGVSYDGIDFMSYEDSIIDDLVWMKKQYKRDSIEINLMFYYDDVNKDLKMKIDEIIAC